MDTVSKEKEAKPMNDKYMLDLSPDEVREVIDWAMGNYLKKMVEGLRADGWSDKDIAEALQTF